MHRIRTFILLYVLLFTSSLMAADKIGIGISNIHGYIMEGNPFIYNNIIKVTIVGNIPYSGYITNFNVTRVPGGEALPFTVGNKSQSGEKYTTTIWVEYTESCNCGQCCKHTCTGTPANHGSCDGTPTGCACHAACGKPGCNACCKHKCSGSNPDYHGNCDATNGDGGCSCHATCGDPNCTACCRCKCSGSNPLGHQPCNGMAGIGGCPCHVFCQCGACCQHKCTGTDPGSHGPCDGTPNDCSCHGDSCTCGVCCICKCKCGKWDVEKNGACIGSCAHKCEGNNCACKNTTGSFPYHHCECHHQESDGACCEHHKYDFTPPPGFKDPGPVTVKDPGPITEHKFDAEELPWPDTPQMINPGNNIPDPGGIPMHPELGVPGEVEKTPLKFFERKEGELFPEFKFEKIFKDFKEKLGDKIPLDALDGFKEGVGSGNFDLSWTVEFDWYNHHYGPLKVDIGKVLKEYSTTDICNNLRNLILFYICIVCLLAVIGIIFDSP